MTDRAPEQRSASVGIGVILIVLGLVFLILQYLGDGVWRFGWPIFVIAPGLAMLAIALSNRGAAGLAIPGAIATSTGVILAIQNVFDLWQTWAYAWTLVAPTAVGLGTWLTGALAGRADLRLQGRRLTTLGLLLFAGFFVFFEGVVNLSGFLRGSLTTFALPALLIGAGAYLLLFRNR